MHPVVCMLLLAADYAFDFVFQTNWWYQPRAHFFTLLLISSMRLRWPRAQVMVQKIVEVNALAKALSSEKDEVYFPLRLRK